MPSARFPASFVALCLALVSTASRAADFSITDFGAKSDDGKVSNTAAIAKAIDAAVRAGGGVVKVPKGKWLTGAVEIKSNVTLHLEKDATLLMSSNPAEYPTVLTRWEGVECYNYSGLIHARDATRVAITGKGTIEGQGQTWWRWARSAEPARRRLRELGETTDDPWKRIFGTPADALRPSLIQFIKCRDVKVEGVTIWNAPMWALHPIECADVSFRDLTIGSKGPNCDGIDVESSRNVLIEKCTISPGEDGVALKSGRDRDGRRTNKPCESITIRDCTFEKGQSAIAIGSETSGGVRNVAIIGCTVKGSARGLRIKTQRGRGGVVEDVRVSDFKLNDVTESAFDIDLLYNPTQSAPAGETTPTVRGVVIGDVTIENAKRIASIRGLVESPVSGVTFRNVKAKADRGVSAQYAADVTLTNLDVDLKSGAAVSAESGAGWTVDVLKAPRASGSEGLLNFKDVAGVTVRKTNAPEATKTFLRLVGKQTKDVKLEGCDTSKATRRIDADKDVPADAVPQ